MNRPYTDGKEDYVKGDKDTWSGGAGGGDRS